MGSPQMFIVAGAPGSGKSTLMPVSSFGVDHFNADDEAAKLNGNSYKAIPQSLRDLVNTRFAAFIEEHIRQRSSFALERLYVPTLPFAKLTPRVKPDSKRECSTFPRATSRQI